MSDACNLTRKKVLIIGAGPAGLTAAYELLKSGEYSVTILEESDSVGGISKTVNYNGNLMDMGGHRFYSKVKKVNDWWNDMLPCQGAMARDDRILNRSLEFSANGPDPELVDKVMLKRHRVSRILFKDKFFDYPISLSCATLINMGFVSTVKVFFSYMAATIHRLPESNLENFYINRFGKVLYSMFFEYYTENLWGRHPSEIDASWGRQRVRGLSILAVIKNVFYRLFKKKRENIETSLIEEFKYPKYGPGQLWEEVADRIEQMGGSIIKGARVTGLQVGGDAVVKSLTYIKDGRGFVNSGDFFISSMPLKDLILGMNHVPDSVRNIAYGLPYRDYMTVGVLLNRLNVDRCQKLNPYGNAPSDCWLYVQDRRVRMGRIQIYNNWSPYLVKDNENTVWIGLEYFVQEGDSFWNMTDIEFSEFAINELCILGLIDDKGGVLDSHVERVEKAYPAYFDTYSEIDKLIDFLNGIPNLYCIGRNGQHRYNNMDHSMCTAFEAVDNIKTGRADKSNVWAVNTESDYLESTAGS